jgi:hypothetical protein
VAVVVAVAAVVVAVVAAVAVVTAAAAPTLTAHTIILSPYVNILRQASELSMVFYFENTRRSNFLAVEASGDH